VAPVRRVVVLLTVVLVTLGLAVAPALAAGFAAVPAGATGPAAPLPTELGPRTPDGPLLLAQSGDEAVQGTLRDAEGEPVEGVVIVVSTPDGEVLGEASSDAEGNWSVPMPGPGEFVATLDQATLPEGAALRDPERDTLEFELRTGQQRTVLFPIGEGGTAGSFLDRFLTQLLSGVRFGLIIAITALGLSLIFGTTGLVNFAHGELVTLGAVLAWFFNAPTPTGFGLTLIAAGLIATVLSAGAGGAVELGLWRPLRRRRTGLIQMLVISIGLALVLRNVIQIWFGGSSRPYFDYTIQQPWTLGPLRLTPRDAAVMLLASLTLVGIATMLQRTRIGKAMRAVADNRDLAESSGIDVQRVILVVWVIGGGLAGFGGVLYGLSENVSYLMGFRLLLLMFAGVILGGLGTAYGAMLGSLVVGLVTELSTLFFSTELKFVWALVVLILILLVRPQGLLGRRERIG
jgi:neutral amino acid transport system permease protein